MGIKMKPNESNSTIMVNCTLKCVCVWVSETVKSVNGVSGGKQISLLLHLLLLRPKDYSPVKAKVPSIRTGSRSKKRFLLIFCLFFLRSLVSGLELKVGSRAGK